MIAVTDPFTAATRPTGLQKGRGGFLRAANDTPYVSDPEGAIVASGPRKGEIKRLAYGSPSGVGRLIENDVGLTKFKQRNTLLGIGMSDDLREACKDLAVLEAGSDEFRKAADIIVLQADNLTRSWLAADRGSHGHAICETYDREGFIDHLHVAGEALGLDIATQGDVWQAWGQLLATNGLEILAIEASCVDDRWRLAGTLDRIVRCTRELRFAMPGGEIVTIPAGTVLILDIKFGKDRLAYAIQIASYAQSVPYDVDAETRGTWPWEISQVHALIAHGDFGGDGRPVAFTLAHVDLVAGREHGGETVARAKAWAARDDVFSVAQLDVEGETDLGDESVSARAAVPISPSTPPVAGPVPIPSPSTPFAGEVEGAACTPSPALTATADGPIREESRVLSARATSAVAPSQPVKLGWPEIPDRVDTSRVAFVDPSRLALVDARGTLATTPLQGADLSDEGAYGELWDAMQVEFNALPPEARSWRAALVTEAQRRGVPFHVQVTRTERTYHINRALIALATAGQCDDEIVRHLLGPIVGDVAYFVGVHPGHIVGSLSAPEAERFAALVDAFLAEPGGDAA